MFQCTNLSLTSYKKLQTVGPSTRQDKIDVNMKYLEMNLQVDNFRDFVDSLNNQGDNFKAIKA
jgi:hypothetical protein